MPIISGNLLSTSTQEEARGNHSVSPELVNKIADLVYDLLMEELRIEKERVRFNSQSGIFGG